MFYKRGMVDTRNITIVDIPFVCNYIIQLKSHILFDTNKLRSIFSFRNNYYF